MSETKHLRVVTASPTQDKPSATNPALRDRESAKPSSKDTPPREPEPDSSTTGGASVDARSELDTLIRAALALLLIGFCLWLGIAWTGYADQFAQAGDNWSKGSKHRIELTLIREDKTNLACASDVHVGDLHCMYRADGKQLAEGSQADANVLRPYNTVKNEPLLAAGLWSSPVMEGQLPTHRFSVVCQFEVTGILRSAGLRWSPTGAFEPSKLSLAAGRLTDCEIPQ